ncbi:hypothetical protein EDB80DRAFT_777987 [Ilyonectria destructans]|nr:hypothetical protein EDB80DRAFT_777987 [Ilyonectria destructans]
MKFHARLAIVLTIARFVEPQSLPSCAQSCAYNTDVFTSASTVCDLFDIACQCTDEEYLSTALCCLYEQCSDSDRKEAEEFSRWYCRYSGHSIPSGIECSTVASSSADMQSTETSGPEQSSVTADDGITTAESTTVDGSSATAESATADSSGSETAANSAVEPSSLPTSDRSGGSSSSYSGTTKDSHALTLKLGLGLGIGLGVPLVVAVIYLALLQRKKLKGQGTPNNQQSQVSSYHAPPPHGYPPSYPPSSYLPQGYPVPSPLTQAQFQQEQFDPQKHEHGGSAGGAVGNPNRHEMIGNIPPSRHELDSNNPQLYGELLGDTRPHNEP